MARFICLSLFVFQLWRLLCGCFLLFSHVLKALGSSKNQLRLILLFLLSQTVQSAKYGF